MAQGERSPPVPRIVVFDDEDAWRRTSEALARSWRVTPGWRLISPAQRRAVHAVVSGTVAGPTDAALAVLAAALEGGVIVLVGRDAPIAPVLVADLARTGRLVLWHPGGPADARARLWGLWGLDKVHERFLRALAHGSTVEEAAAEFSLSPRTAARRLREARERLGVDTTVEAVVVWVRQRPRD